MRILNPMNNLLLLGFCFTGISYISAQDSTNSDNPTVFTTIEIAPPSDPTVSISQDPKIQQLLDIKTKMDKDGEFSDNYKIQLYNGNMNEAQKVLKKAEALFPQWNTEIKWETPEFKVWIGNYRTKLERDRALREIKAEFSGAFGPQKNK
ncbi:SPOR domain-containing protein [Aquimarina sp. 2201CG14-23]|uniref:SPOR domain-containing protein n=1 Tax=Aquimarina mycalae TaxID=3040073 RepID=UPI00247824AC|nr:SPOR domain-containing protein [Aquimarina sp. 2201CG14-23]MDH7445394.1 SPOR domain-containing protein [Aquimarina sp. 2201CG14-23]